MVNLNDFFTSVQFITALTIIAAVLYFALFERKTHKHGEDNE